MTHYDVVGVYHYEMPGLGIWARKELLGEVWSGTFGDYSIEVKIPDSREAFGLAEADEFAVGHARFDGPDGGARSISVIQVVVHGEADFTTDDLRNERVPIDDVHAKMAELIAVADEFVLNWVNHIRSTFGQHWLGTSSDPPRRTWISSLSDSTGKRFPVSPGISAVSIVPGLDVSIDRSDLDRLGRGVVNSEAVALPEELLADAKYLAWIRQPHDLRLAVLLAAIATETKVKRVLSGLARPDQALLVELVMNSPRDVSVAVVSHLNKTALAVTGRSLKEDDPELWKAVTRLFEARNTIAHGKEPQPSDADLAPLVRAAKGVFEWLDALGEPA